MQQSVSVFFVIDRAFGQYEHSDALCRSRNAAAWFWRVVSFSSALVTLKCERNVRCVVGHLKISAPIDDPCRLSRRLMALRRKAVCAANHNKDACGLSFRLTLADIDWL